jgi:hypothetical protein
MAPWGGMAMNDNSFQPDAFQTSYDEETGDVLIRFSRQEQLQASVHLHREQVATLVAKLLALPGNTRITPISAHALYEGVEYRPVSSEFRPLADGSLRITFGLNLDGRIVTLPVTFQSDDVGALAVVANALVKKNSQP